MKAMRVLGTVLAIGLGLSAVTSASDAYAQAGKARGKKEAPAPQVAAEPPDTKKPVGMKPAGLAWGMTIKQVGEVVDKVLDEDYKPLLIKASPGINQKNLTAELGEAKSAFRRSQIDFGKIPTGVDASPLKGEYTYMNKESMLILTRNGQNRYFFFIQNKLWKVIDEHKLAEGSPLGKTWEEAVLKMVKIYGVPGRVREADFDKGRNATEVDWKDATTHVRVIQRGETALAIAYEDRTTLGMIDSLRTNKPAATDEIDPAVAAAIRGSKAPEPPPAPADKGVKKK